MLRGEQRLYGLCESLGPLPWPEKARVVVVVGELDGGLQARVRVCVAAARV